MRLATTATGRECFSTFNRNQPMATGDQLETPAQAAPQQPLQLQPSTPSVAGTSRNPHLHRLIGSVLGALAGQPDLTYAVDPSGKMIATAGRPRTIGENIRKISADALVGLGAGAQVGPQKSSLASVAAGLGAGAQALVRTLGTPGANTQKYSFGFWLFLGLSPAGRVVKVKLKRLLRTE